MGQEMDGWIFLTLGKLNFSIPHPSLLWRALLSPLSVLGAEAGPQSSSRQSHLPPFPKAARRGAGLRAKRVLGLREADLRGFWVNP